MNDSLSLADKARADIAAHRRFSSSTLLCRLGVAAAIAAASSLAATMPAPAQSQPAPGAQTEPPKAPPKRRGISNPDAISPSAAPSPAGKSYKGGDEDSTPGGLPGARPKTQPMPGGPANPGG